MVRAEGERRGDAEVAAATPRQAQNRSLFWVALHVRTVPSAVTMWTA
jgi:hypothetical protein